MITAFCAPSKMFHGNCFTGFAGHCRRRRLRGASAVRLGLFGGGFGRGLFRFVRFRYTVRPVWRSAVIPCHHSSAMICAGFVFPCVYLAFFGVFPFRLGKCSAGVFSGVFGAVLRSFRFCLPSGGLYPSPRPYFFGIDPAPILPLQYPQKIFYTFYG